MSWILLPRCVVNFGKRLLEIPRGIIQYIPNISPIDGKHQVNPVVFAVPNGRWPVSDLANNTPLKLWQTVHQENLALKPVGWIGVAPGIQSWRAESLQLLRWFSHFNILKLPMCNHLQIVNYSTIICNQLHLVRYFPAMLESWRVSEWNWCLLVFSKTPHGQ